MRCQSEALRLVVKQADGIRASAASTQTVSNLDEANITRETGVGFERSHPKTLPFGAFVSSPACMRGASTKEFL
jgi:hypothetical protein